jgi:hypothetical protein
LDQRKPNGWGCDTWGWSLAQGAADTPRHGQERRCQGDLFQPLANGEIVLLLVYAKAKFDNLRPELLLKLKERFDA